VTVIKRLQRSGIRRLGRKEEGFRYERSGGLAVSARNLERIGELRIPPAWRDVAIHPSSRGTVQAVGRDAAGRWQYLYHRAHAARREKRKYERLVRFARALPRLRASIERDLALPGLPRRKILACVSRILACCFLRPGSRAYTRDNGSYGLTTLRRRHVSVRGDLVSLDFPGKAGKRQTREIRDRRIARILRLLADGPGEVFRYRADGGAWTRIRRRHVNDYIKRSMGEAFSAKDFRTWAATLLCACSLARLGADARESKAARRKKVVAAIRETARRLGNTPAICRASYISPRVLGEFERARVIEPHAGSLESLLARRSPRFARPEKALLRLLDSGASVQAGRSGQDS
jgi:DNA topoisomerase-1